MSIAGGVKLFQTCHAGRFSLLFGERIKKTVRLIHLNQAIAFLFSAGFAFGPPPHSSVIAEMVSAEELGSAYTLAGLQMDVSGLSGRAFGALACVGRSELHLWRQRVRFHPHVLPILQWKRPKVQSSLPLEDFFESLTTAIRYLRYSPGIKILLARHALLPVVGLIGTTSESFSPGISGFSRDLADLLLQDMKQAIGHFERHPVCKSLTHEEASGFHH
jgi:hypothetical protein